VPRRESRAERTVAEAEKIAALLREQGVETAVIGAVAAAVHGYPRATADLDLASSVDPYRVLQPFAGRLVTLGYEALLHEPDADDPLGGVLTVRGRSFREIQIVNFANPWRGGTPLGREAIEHAMRNALGSLSVVDLAHLVALKLYAGGPQGKLDVIELLSRNPDADVGAIRAVCKRFGLAGALDAVVAST
jgi:hypothetical protein